MKDITIYTDGACSGNPGPGGYAAVLIYGATEKHVSGFQPHTTNNRMELLAPISALEQLKEKCKVSIYSDSAYLVDAFNKGWIYKWSQFGWTTKDGKNELKNGDLWQKLYELSQYHQIEWIKVKGHSDNEYNNLCDKMAVDEIKKNTLQVNHDIHHITLKSHDLKEFEEKTLSSDIILNGKIFDIERLKVSTPYGNTATRDILRHPGAAAVLPLDSDGSVYMIRQYRKPIDEITIEIPAGKLDADEKPSICAARELKEETGLTAGEMFFLTSMYPTFAVSDEVIHIYLATGLTRGEQDLDANEYVTVEKYPLKDLVELVIKGVIQDAKTITAILMAEKYVDNQLKI